MKTPKIALNPLQPASSPTAGPLCHQLPIGLERTVSSVPYTSPSKASTVPVCPGLRVSALLAMLVCLLSLPPMRAGAQHKLDSLHTLRGVLVEAEYRREMIPGMKLKGEQLQKLSSFSVADAIRYFSGVQLKDYGGMGGLKTVNIRSMGTNHMGVFYDGIQLGNAQNGQIDLGKFSLDNIEEISLHNGQKSGMLQSARDYGSAGTIYLRTKAPVFKAGEKTHLRAKVKTGSFMLLGPSILWEQKLSERLAVNVNTELISSDGRYKFRYKRVFADGTVAYDTTAVRKNGDITAIRLESTLFGTLADGQWDLHGYYYKSHRGLPGPIVKNVFEHGQRLHDENYFIQSKFRKRFSPFYSLQIRAKYANDYTRYIDREWTSPTYVDNQYLQHEVYLSAANKISPWSFLQFNAAVDFSFNKMQANLVNFSEPTRYTLLAAIAAELDLGSFSVQASGLGSFVRESVKKNTAAPPKNIFTPALLFSWKPIKGSLFKLNAFYKNIFRMPTFNDLYYTFIGNSVLKPEYATQYNIGLEHQIQPRSSWIKSVGFKTDVYYNQISDKIVAVPAGNMFRWMMINLGKVAIKGAELNTHISTEPLSGLMATLRLSYTFQEAVDVTSPKDKNYRHQIPYIPRHAFSVISSAEYKGYALNYSFIYTGVRYNAKYNDLNSQQQPWYTSDIGIRKDFRWRGGYLLRALLDVNNLLNQHYDVVLNYPMPGRNYRLTLSFMM